MKWPGKWKELNIQEVHGEVSINILRGSNPMKLWKNLSKEQKRMAKIAIFNTLMTSIIMVIIKPIVKDEPFVITEKIIEFAIFVVVIFAFNCIFIIGARTPKGK